MEICISFTLEGRAGQSIGTGGTPMIDAFAIRPGSVPRVQPSPLKGPGATTPSPHRKPQWNSMLQRFAHAGIVVAPQKPSPDGDYAAAIQRSNDYARNSLVDPTYSLEELHTEPKVHFELSDLAAALLFENADDPSVPGELIKSPTELIEKGGRVHAAQLAMADARDQAAAMNDDTFVKAEWFFRHDAEARSACRGLLLRMARPLVRITEAQARLEGEMGQFIAMRKRYCDPWKQRCQLLEDENVRLQKVSESLSRDLREAIEKLHANEAKSEAERQALLAELNAIKLLLEGFMKGAQLELETVIKCFTWQTRDLEFQVSIIAAKWREEVEALEAQMEAQRVELTREMHELRIRARTSRLMELAALESRLVGELRKQCERRLEAKAEEHRLAMREATEALQISLASARKETEQARKETEQVRQQALKEAEQALQEFNEYTTFLADKLLRAEDEKARQEEEHRKQCEELQRPIDELRRLLEEKGRESMALRHEMARLQSLFREVLAEGSLEPLRRKQVGFTPLPETALLGKARLLILEEALKLPAAFNGHPQPAAVSWRGTTHDYQRPGTEFHQDEWERPVPTYAPRPNPIPNPSRKPPPLFKQSPAHDGQRLHGHQPEPPTSPPHNQPKSPSRPRHQAPPARPTWSPMGSSPFFVTEQSQLQHSTTKNSPESVA